MPYATVSDVEIDYGPVPDADIDKVETMLERAEARIKQVFADLDDRIASGRTTLVLVKQVESEMVSSVLRNPAGVRSLTESVGPFSRTTGYANSNAASDAIVGGLELTARHRALLGERTLLGGPFVVPLS